MAIGGSGGSGGSNNGQSQKLFRFTVVTPEQSTKTFDSLSSQNDKLLRAANWTKIPGNGVSNIYFTDTGEWHYLDTVGDEKTYIANPSGGVNLKQEIFYANRVPIFSISYAYDVENKLVNTSCWNGSFWGYYDLNFSSIGIPTFSAVKCKLPSLSSMLKGIQIQLSDTQFAVDRTYQLNVWAYETNVSWPNQSSSKHIVATDTLTLQACELNNVLDFEFNCELSDAVNYFIELSTTGQPFPLKTIPSRNMLVKADLHGEWIDVDDIVMTISTEAIQPPILYTDIKFGFTGSGTVNNILFRLGSSSFSATDFLFRFMKLFSGNPWPNPSSDGGILDVACSSSVDSNGSYVSIPMSIPVADGEYYYLELYRTGGGSFPMKLLGTQTQSAGGMISGVWTWVNDFDVEISFVP